MNGLLLDVSALLAYASGESIEPGAMIALAGEDADQQVWIPALCLGEAVRRVVGSKQSAVLDVLTGPASDVDVAVCDGATSWRVARIAAEHDLRSMPHTPSRLHCCTAATWSRTHRMLPRRPNGSALRRSISPKPGTEGDNASGCGFSREAQQEIRHLRPFISALIGHNFA